MAGDRRDALIYVGGFTALYFACNWGLNIVNKWTLHTTGLPLFLTFTHMAFSFIVLFPFMLSRSLRAKHYQTIAHHWKGLCAIGMLMALNICLSNASLVKLSLSLNQVIRASMPVMTVGMAYLIEGHRPATATIASLVVLSFGVGLCLWQGQATGTLGAITLCVLSTLANAACLSFSGKLLTEKIDVLRLTFYISPITAVFTLPALLHLERGAVAEGLQVNGRGIAAMFAVSSVLAVAHNLVNYKLVQHTSAVSATVIGEVKTITLILLSAFLLGERSIFTLQLTLGCVIAMAGFCWYSHCKLAERAAAAAAAAKAAELPEVDMPAALAPKTAAARPPPGHAVASHRDLEAAPLAARATWAVEQAASYHPAAKQDAAMVPSITLGGGGKLYKGASGKFLADIRVTTA